MAAPITAVFFLTQVGLGLVVRFSPEINILMVSFPVTILLGFFFMMFSTALWGDAMAHYFEQVFLFIRTLTVV
jgi:flagellar biosynthesis protein FliR